MTKFGIAILRYVDILIFNDVVHKIPLNFGLHLKKFYVKILGTK